MSLVLLLFSDLVLFTNYSRSCRCDYWCLWRGLGLRPIFFLVLLFGSEIHVRGVGFCWFGISSINAATTAKSRSLWTWAEQRLCGWLDQFARSRLLRGSQRTGKDEQLKEAVAVVGAELLLVILKSSRAATFSLSSGDCLYSAMDTTMLICCGLPVQHALGFMFACLLAWEPAVGRRNARPSTEARHSVCSGLTK